MIIVIEGISAAGKSTWCAAQGGDAVVPEHGRIADAPGAESSEAEVARFWAARNVDRWRAALATEQRCRTAICDTDPLKLHYTWGLRQLGVVSERHWQAAVAATRHTIAAGEIGFADAYFVQPVDPAVATSRAAGDVRRTRRNFALHLRLQPSLLDWYRTLDRVLPGRVAFGWPDALPQLSPRERCPGPAVFDALIGALPTP